MRWPVFRVDLSSDLAGRHRPIWPLVSGVQAGHYAHVATAAVDPADFADAERRLGVRIPNSLRALYSDGDGRYDDGGHWWVVWPIDQLVAENEEYWREGWLDRSLLAFGDDGTGDPFCLSTTTPSR